MANIELKDLLPGKTYNIQLRAKNDEGEYSEWSDIKSFTTPADFTQQLVNLYQTQLGSSGKIFAGTPTIPNTPVWKDTQLGFYVDASGYLSLKNQLYFDPTGSGSLTVNGTINQINIGRGTGSLATNLALGTNALISSNSGTGYNVAVGDSALYSNTTGYQNVALGNNSLSSITSGYNNIGIGQSAGSNNTTGASNIYIGTFSGTSSSGTGNVIIGGYGGTLSTGNTLYISSGNSNASTAQVWISGDSSYNVTIPNGTLTVEGASNLNAATTVTVTGTSAFTVQSASGANSINVSTSTTKYVQVTGSTRTTDNLAVLGTIYASSTITQNSSKRYKKNIQTFNVPESLLEINPVTFIYDETKTEVADRDIGVTHFGAIAEDFVDRGISQVVAFDPDGNIDGLEYNKIAVLLIPLIKQQKDRIEDLEKRIALLENK